MEEEVQLANDKDEEINVVNKGDEEKMENKLKKVIPKIRESCSRPCCQNIFIFLNRGSGKLEMVR